MSARVPSRAVYLDLAPDAVFGVFHDRAPGSRSETGVLICPPWGWDEVTAYRSLRDWAELLAEAGHPALRIDLPGTGDSAGAAGDPERLAGWSAAVVAGVAWLRATAGCARVAVIGLGLGGLAVGKAIAEGADIDDLVLWATPTSGRTYLREARAFASLQTSRYSLGGEPEPQMLPDGWLEIGGFVLSAETIEDLGSLSLTSLELGRLRRVLLLERDGIAVDAKLQKHLEEAGVDVTVAPGPGWGAMCFHPERYASPVAVFERVGAWLDAAPAPAGSPAAQAGSTVARAQKSLDETEFDVDGRRVRETALVIDLPIGRITGVLAEPVERSPSPLGAVFLNAGAVRRIGPNRMWVEAARRWAARGIPSIRLDLEGIGDSDGDPNRWGYDKEFYTERTGDQVRAAVDVLELRAGVHRIMLVGLCSGAYWGFHQAERDERVTSAVLLNARQLIWDPELEARRAARKVEGMLRPSTWGRILRGEVAPAAAWAVASALGKRVGRAAIRAPRRLLRAATAGRAVDPMDTTLDRLQAKHTRVVIAFSGDEPMAAELRADGLFRRLDRWPNVAHRELPGLDHTFRPIVAQAAVQDLLDEELEAELGRVVEPSGRGSQAPTGRHVELHGG
ncbi:MAG TPA: hypothetical protein VF323_01060 [Candidatus Limnocylindrales bacterium]